MKKIASILFQVCLATVGIIGTNASIAIAQITSDGTVNTQVNQNGNVAEITGGEARGGNLFHSFQDFSVPTNNAAFFDNANDIANIFSRVTGGNVSSIDGLIRANDTNLFLINPAGILFGAGAKLDLGGGSFYGTSADSILFKDGEFSGTDLANPPLLTINAPIGLRFRDNPADITVRGNGNGTRLTDSAIIDIQDALRVDADATIGILGGNLIFEDATIKTAGGRVELGSVREGEVNLVKVAKGFTFDYSAIEVFQDISLSGTSVIDASGNGGGDIQVAGKNISLNDISAIEANSLGSEAGGNVNVLASDSLAISGIENENNFISAISSRVFPNGTGNAGDINIETGNLSIGDRAALLTSTFGQGNAGNIKIVTGSFTGDNRAFLSADNSGQGNAGNVAIDAATNIDLTNSSSINVSGTEGSSGNIELNANSLTIDNSSQLFAGNLGQEAGGNVTINTSENVDLANNSGLLVSGFPGGSISITANNLSLLSGSNIFAGIGVDSGTANIQSGDIIINLNENLVVDGLDGEGSTSIGNSSFGRGNSGNVEVNAKNVTLSNGGRINSFTTNEGNTGSITLNASGDINLDGIQGGSRSGVANFITAGATGNSGEINIRAQNLTLTNGSIVESLVSGTANSGDINLNIDNTTLIDGVGNFTQDDATQATLPSVIDSDISSGGIGNAGNINLNTQNLALSRNGKISTTITQGQGNAGNINIDAELITIGEQGDTSTSPSSIASEATTGLFNNPLLEANGGNIAINTGSLLISDGGGIEVGIRAIGNGGDITINATDTVSIDGTGTFIAPGEIDDSGTTVIPGMQNEIELSSDIRAGVDPASVGDGGSIEISAANFALTNDAIVTSSNRGQGNAGNINIEVTDRFTADSGLITSNIGTPQGVAATGQVGSINIRAREINFSDTAQIQAGLFSGTTGDPGVISVTATESISFTGENTGIFSDNDPNSVGDASNARLSAPNILLDDNAVIQASNQGEGNGGNILITADNLNLERNNLINASTVSGTGGTVTLDIAENIVLRSGNLISAEALNDANGGNININTGFIVAFPNKNNDIVARADRGNGGNITINAESLFGIEERSLNSSSNDINASSAFSLDGTVSINTPDLNPVQGATELPNNLVAPEETIAQACQSNREAAAKNNFTINGKGGVLPAPGVPLNSQNITIGGEIDFVSITPQPIKTSKGKIQPARGIEINQSGDVILTAHQTSNSQERLAKGNINCET